MSETKIVRVNYKIHASFKDLAKRHGKKLNEAAEIVFASSIKRDTIEEVKENAYSAIKELDKTFRSWMKTQERDHLEKISDEILSVARNIQDFGTKTDLNNAIKNSFQLHENNYKILINQYNVLTSKQQNFKQNLIKATKLSGIILSISIIIFSLLFSFSVLFQRHYILNYKVEREKYDYLHSYCEEIEKKYKIKFIEVWDEFIKTEKDSIINKARKDVYVYKDN